MKTQMLEKKKILSGISDKLDTAEERSNELEGTAVGTLQKETRKKKRNTQKELKVEKHPGEWRRGEDTEDMVAGHGGQHDEYDAPAGARFTTHPEHKRQKEKLHQNPSYPIAPKQ